MWKSHILTLLSPNVEWCKCWKLMRKFKMQISTQTDRENQKKMSQPMTTAFWEKWA